LASALFARRALQKPVAAKRLDNVLDGVARLDSAPQSFRSHRPHEFTATCRDSAGPSHRANGIHFQQRQRAVGEFLVILSAPSTMAKSRTRRSSLPAMRGVPRERRDFARRLAHATPSTRARAAHQLQFLDRIKIQPHRNAEAITQRVVNNPALVVAPTSVNLRGRSSPSAPPGLRR